ncbi:serine hydrolase [Siphonobacter sp. SORGH_AS_0500]|uniref:serine hydrolase n=1 Tax=Siphonobacter sp. SORGH_AS_0500 TaxID=1864824 RepID=UPI00285F5268|nr:serine hydrolase [Siphonobacter sp. SORGH_AS_0500]MDR6193674.1 CubicO group peptidase (beta-lactamase class C family) [Siphonobacter sp. SORGH_AS_0500]
MLFNRWIYTLLFLLPFIDAYAQRKFDENLSLEIDSLFSQRLPAIAPGGVLLIARQGHALYHKAFGNADVSNKTLMQPDMIFRIGSMTKQFTAVAILQLVEAGKLSLQDSIQKYIKDFPSKGHTLTIEHLLTNTSGIKNYFEINNPTQQRPTYTPAQGVDYFKDEPLSFVPGSQFEYSNSNYYLLGYLIEVITGQTYEQYLREHVLAKANLTHTSYILPDSPVSPMPTAYTKVDRKLKKARLQEVSTLYAAGGLLSSATDLLTWHQALLEGKLISRPLLKKAWASFKLNNGTDSPYGYGWYMKELDGQPTIEHSGSTDGFQTNAVYLPQADLYVTTLFNSYETDMDWIVLTNDIIGQVFGRKPYTLTIPQLQAYIGTYTYKKSYQMVITLEESKLYIRATNPKSRLPKVQLHPRSDGLFFIKEAELSFSFERDTKENVTSMASYYRNTKDVDWKKEK